MTIEKIQAEMIAAMKNRDKERKETLSSLIQSIKKFGIDNLCKDTMTEEQIDAVILKEKKTIQEQIDTCPVDRIELMEKYKAKMSVINEFAPTIMENEAEIVNHINGLGIELVKANRGAIMKALKGKADMKIANQAVAKMLK